MGKHFGLGEFRACDTCGTYFWQDPVDKNETCIDCIDRKPIPTCVDCEMLLKRDHKGERCYDCEDKHVDAFWRAKAKKDKESRVAKEGFETTGYDPNEGATCEFRLFVKPKARWVHQPCGDPAVIELELLGPQNPSGLKVKLCRTCLGRHIRELVKYLEG